MKFKVNQKVYCISKYYADNRISEGTITKIDGLLHVVEEIHEGITFYTSTTLNNPKTYLESNVYNKLYFATKDDAIMYHNSLVEDHIEGIRNEYTIRNNK